MTMTGRDYAKIAEVISSTTYYVDKIKDFEDSGQSTLQLVAVKLALLFTQENPNFDNNAFMKACGLWTQ